MTELSGTKAALRAQTGLDPRATHGHYTLERHVKAVRRRAKGIFSRRTQEGQELESLRLSYVEMLGGAEAVTPAQLEVVREICVTTLLLANINAYLAELGPRIINRRYKRLAPIIAQRQVLIDSRLRHLQAIGLERRARSVTSLRSLVTGAATA
ncbi:MAG TPA: hypothetical protein VK130_08185 [Steroidobacteraceae bacterium]|nr:hypothetical protein [Steroidobacteraceae bacterium]